MEFLIEVGKFPRPDTMTNFTIQTEQ